MLKTYKAFNYLQKSVKIIFTQRLKQVLQFGKLPGLAITVIKSTLQA